MNDADQMLVKQFLLRIRQEGYSIAPNPPRSLGGINIDIFRGKTKICTFDDRQLGEGCRLRVRTDDSTREEIKQDYYKIFYAFIHLRDLYSIYEAAAPLQGFDQSLGYRAIMQHGNCILAVRSNTLGELEFGTFMIDNDRFSSRNTIRDNKYYDMDAYPLAKLDFVSRSGLLSNDRQPHPR